MPMMNTYSTDPSRAGKACPDPATLLARDDLTEDEKIARLHQWELDLREKLVADEEAMTSNLAADDPCQASEQLTEVLQVLEHLGSGAEPHPAPTKQG